jgi:4'-phosphopantetheinyl transferase
LTAANPPGLLPHEDEGHVWLASLDRTEGELRVLALTLSPDEKTRAERFHFPRDRDHFVAGRGLLRILLAGYTGQAPGDLHFTTNRYGKPQLAAPAEAPHPLRFNVSHSRDVALYAVARGREVGVDVEWMGRDLDFEGLAARFFSPRESAALGALPPDARRGAFFACWTRKEAYVKARGQGLSLGLDTFDVSLALGGPPEPVRSTAEPGAEERWSVYGFTPAADYAAALAVEGRPWRLLWRQLPEPLEGVSVDE